MDGMNLEIWFPQQDQVSVFLESSVIDSDEERFHETSLFALFATRQLANLRGDWVANSLAATLADIDLHRPADDAREKLGDVQLVTPSAPGGRKGFTAELRPEKRGFFKMHPRGFGMLGKGVSYYAPTSTVALLAYLLDRRSDDDEYARALTATAKFVGHAGAQGAIGVTSSAQVAMKAAAAGWAFAMEGESEDEDSDDGEKRRVVLVEGARLASQHGVDLLELSNTIIEEFAAARPPDAEPGVLWFPNEAIRAMCAVDFVARSTLDDPRLNEAFARSAASSDDESLENLQQVAQRVLEERRLTPVVDALVILIRADDVDDARRAGD